MSASDHINVMQFHFTEPPKSTKRMYPRHTPRSEVRTVSHVTRGHKGNQWQRKAAHG